MFSFFSFNPFPISLALLSFFATKCSCLLQLLLSTVDAFHYQVGLHAHVTVYTMPLYSVFSRYDISIHVQQTTLLTGDVVLVWDFCAFAIAEKNAFQPTSALKYESWWRRQMETFSVLLALCEGIPLVTGGFPTKASDAERCCFLWSAPEKTAEQTIETPVIWDAIAVIMMSQVWYSAYQIMHCLFFNKTVHTALKLSTPIFTDWSSKAAWAIQEPRHSNILRGAWIMLSPR